MKYTILESAFGWIGIIFSDKGARFITLPLPSSAAAMSEIAGRSGDTPAFVSPDPPLCKALAAYFTGERTGFDCDLDMSGYSPFRQRVWNAARSIPYGTTRSYAWVAAQIGQPAAARAVGQALGDNPFPIVVPCHRVIGSQGDLHGFGGGLDMKARLLELEGCPVRG